MYCTQCGAENDEGNKICVKCGAAMTAPPTAPPSATSGTSSATAQPTIVAKKTSGFAIASLVLGILGFFLTLPSIFAIIFGGIALGQIHNNPALKGKGMAIAGIVLGILVVLMWVAILLWVGSYYSWF